VEFGVRIRQLREERGLSLQDLAKRANLSRPFLYQIEAGTAAPSLKSITRISEALDTSMATLFSDPETPGAPADSRGARFAPTVDRAHSSERNGGGASVLGTGVRRVEPVRRNRRKVIIWPDSNERGFLLTPDLLGQIEVTLAEHEPGAPMFEAHSHDGVVLLYCLEGSYEVWVDGERHVIHDGDALTFPASLAHTYRLISEEPGRAIWIETPTSP
jgi:transcriptional regulator with XRE-family HTH domain